MPTDGPSFDQPEETYTARVSASVSLVVAAVSIYAATSGQLLGRVMLHPGASDEEMARQGLAAWLQMAEGKRPHDARKDALLGETPEGDGLPVVMLVAPPPEELLPSGGIIAARGDARVPHPSPRTGTPVPPTLPQQTFQEIRNLSIGLTDGPSGRRWKDVDGEVAMVHVIPDQPIQVRFSPSSLMLAWWSEPPTYAHLRAELKNAGAPAVLLAHVAVGLVLERGRTTIALEDLRQAIGWTRRESILVEQQLRRVWRILLLLSSMPIIGQRDGTYKDPRTGKVIDLISRDPLLVVRGERYADGPPKATDVPVDVSLDGGAWIDQHRGNRRILTDFGDVLRLAAIPAGKPAGAWAQSIGLALNQRWRERAAGADVARVGEDGHDTVRFKQPFTRRDLLDMFRADPYYRDVLDGPNPKRARTYWDTAIGLLKAEGVIGHYAELKPLGRDRQGWQGAWLTQPLDIRPAEDGRQDAAKIARSARVAAAKAKRPRRQATA